MSLITIPQLVSTKVARPKPFIWVTWLTKLLAGENQCEYQIWFKAHYKGHTKEDNRDGDLGKWMIEHTELVTNIVAGLPAGNTTYTEDQADFFLQGQTADVSGKADVITIFPGDEPTGLIIDAKTGQQKASDIIQVQVYQYLAARTHRWKGRTYRGMVKYKSGKEIMVEPERQTIHFIDTLAGRVRRLADPSPPPHTPSIRECSQCELTTVDCSRKMVTLDEEISTTEEF